MHVNTNLGFAIATLLQSLVLIYVVFHYAMGPRRSKGFFIGYLLVLSFQIVLKGLSKLWVMDQLGFFSIVAYELPFLYGPLAFLYVKSTLHKGVSWQRELLHLIPFTIALGILLLFTLDTHNRTVLHLLPNTLPKRIIHAVILCTCSFVYFSLSDRIIRVYSYQAAEQMSSYEKVKLPWLRQFNVWNVVVSLMIIVALELMYHFYPDYSGIRYFFLSLTALVYWFSYKMIRFPHVFDLSLLKIVPFGASLKETTPLSYAVFKPTTDESLLKKKASGIEDPASLSARVDEAVQEPEDAPLESGKPKYAKNKLTDEDAGAIFNRLKEYLEHSRAYLDRDLTLDKIAQATGMSKHNISQVLNEKIKTTYFDFINEYRIAHAGSLLKDPSFDHLTIAAIAHESGFNSASGFNMVFKKRMGETPSHFKRNRGQKKDSTQPTAVGLSIQKDKLSDAG